MVSCEEDLPVGAKVIWVGLKERVGPLFTMGETCPVKVTVPLKELMLGLKSCTPTDVEPPAKTIFPPGGMEMNNWKSGWMTT